VTPKQAFHKGIVVASVFWMGIPWLMVGHTGTGLGYINAAMHFTIATFIGVFNYRRLQHQAKAGHR